MVTGLVIVLFACELQPYPIKFGGLTLFLWICIISSTVLILCLVTLLVIGSKIATFWLMSGYVSLIVLLDLVFITTHVRAFWVPTFITMAVLSVIWILHFFDVPQRFYYDMRLPHLFF